MNTHTLTQTPYIIDNNLIHKRNKASAADEKGNTVFFSSIQEPGCRKNKLTKSLKDHTVVTTAVKRAWMKGGNKAIRQKTFSTRW